jgi:hypothetical protein
MEALHMVLGIQARHPELLVVEMPHLQHEQGREISRLPDALIRRRREQYLEQAHERLHLLW